MSLKKAYTIRMASLISAVVLFFIAKVSLNERVMAVCLCIAGAIFLVGEVIWLIWGRCPECGRHIWKYFPKHCGNCGAKIWWW